MKALSPLLAVPALILSISTTQAAQRQIGSALTVVNLVTAEFNRDVRSLQDGDRVHQNETIEVGSDASSELKLDDDTKLALGAGSHLTLDKFVYDPDKTSGSIVVNLVKGTFRFMTGVAEKPAYTIKTPAASITVRGTIFDVFIQPDGTEWLLLHEGGVRACNTRRQCKDLDEPGKLIRIGDDGNVGPPVKWASLPGKDAVPFDTAFPFVAKSPSIDPTPILTRDEIILGTLPTPDKPDKLDKPNYEDDSKPTKKKAERTKTTPTEKKTKKQKTAKKSGSSGDENIVKGMDIVIGIGGGLGKMGGNKKGGHKGGGDYGKSGGGMGGMGGMKKY